MLYARSTNNAASAQLRCLGVAKKLVILTNGHEPEVAFLDLLCLTDGRACSAVNKAKCDLALNLRSALAKLVFHYAVAATYRAWTGRTHGRS